MATHSLAPAPEEQDLPAAAAIGLVRGWLRAEGALVLARAILAYRHLSGSWAFFAVLFLAPNLTMAGYLFGPGRGASIYNLGHSYLAPALLGAAGSALAMPELCGPALIGAAHIGADRLLGFGLKYPAGFGATPVEWRLGDHSAFLAVSSR